MSTCVSSHGEYSSHVPDGDFNCTRCWALDEDGLRAEVARLAAENTRLRAVAEAVEMLTGDPNDPHWPVIFQALRAWREGDNA